LQATFKRTDPGGHATALGSGLDMTVFFPITLGELALRQGSGNQARQSAATLAPPVEKPARICCNKETSRGVAQPGRALRSGRRGRWFESSHPDQEFPYKSRVFQVSTNVVLTVFCPLVAN
jgi:hypothetical protein